MGACFVQVFFFVVQKPLVNKMSGGKECWVSVPWISRSGEKYKPPRIGAKYQVKQIPPATLHGIILYVQACT